MNIQTKYVKLEIFIPETHFLQLRNTLRAVRAGQSGNYDSCLAYSRVIGSWRPLEGASPYEGTIGELCEAPELKVEVRVELSCLEKTMAAIRAVHPYETPVIFTIPLMDENEA